MLNKRQFDFAYLPLIWNLVVRDAQISPLRVCVCACSWSDWILLKYIFLLCSYMFTKRQDIRCIHFHVIICYWYQHRIPLISQPVNFTKMHVNVIVKENKEKSTVCNEHKELFFFIPCSVSPSRLSNLI